MIKRKARDMTTTVGTITKIVQVLIAITIIATMIRVKTPNTSTLTPSCHTALSSSSHLPIRQYFFSYQLDTLKSFTIQMAVFQLDAYMSSAITKSLNALSNAEESVA